MDIHTIENINDINNYSIELWQRQHIGLHTYIPKIVISICAIYSLLTR